MSKCTRCDTNLIGTAENPPDPQLCHYCERDDLKAQLELNQELVRRFRDVLSAFANGYDCDSDAHKYNQPCRACVAKRALAGHPKPFEFNRGTVG